MEPTIRQAIVGKYVLQPWVLDVIKKKAVRQRIAADMGLLDTTLMKYIRDNSDNLTKLAAMEIIRKVTGREKDKDLAMINPAWKKGNEIEGELFQ